MNKRAKMEQQEKKTKMFLLFNSAWDDDQLFAQLKWTFTSCFLFRI